MLLKNGHLIDPTTKTNEFMDIRIENGIITKIAKDLTSETGEESLICPALQLLRDSSTLMFISEIPDLLIKKIFIPVLLPLQRVDLPPSSVWRTPNQQ